MGVSANIFQGAVGNLPHWHENCPTYFTIECRNFVPIKLIRIHAQLYHVI